MLLSYVADEIYQKFDHVQKISQIALGNGFHQYVAVKAQKGLKARISIVDSPGYDPRSKESVDRWRTAVEGEIERRLDAEIAGLDHSGLSGVSKTEMSNKGDQKIHLILHLVDGTGSDFTRENVAAINHFSSYCAVLPVISKADLLQEKSPPVVKELILKAAINAGLKWFDLKEVDFCH